MRTKLFILSIMIIIFFSCKKEMDSQVEHECRLTLLGAKDTIDFGNIYFHYSNQNKLIGVSFFQFTGKVNEPYIPRFDTIIYNVNGNATIYRYLADLNLNKDKTPTHSQKYTFKTDITLKNNLPIKITKYDSSNILVVEQEFLYFNDKLSKIQESGKKLLHGYILPKPIYLKTDYEIMYENENVKSIISQSKDSNGAIVGGDTTIYKSYSLLKNPFKSVQLLDSYNILSLSKNIYTSHEYKYMYKIENSNIYSGSSQVSRIFTNDGKDYPKELGEVKCD